MTTYLRQQRTVLDVTRPEGIVTKTAQLQPQTS
jgi:hypothetical protein